MVQMQEIMKMSVAERILMIEKIWDSIDHDNIETPASHQQELDKRLARFEKGETAFFSWADIRTAYGLNSRKPARRLPVRVHTLPSSFP